MCISQLLICCIFIIIQFKIQIFNFYFLFGQCVSIILRGDEPCIVRSTAQRPDVNEEVSTLWLAPEQVTEWGEGWAERRALPGRVGEQYFQSRVLTHVRKYRTHLGSHPWGYWLLGNWNKQPSKRVKPEPALGRLHFLRAWEEQVGGKDAEIEKINNPAHTKEDWWIAIHCGLLHYDFVPWGGILRAKREGCSEAGKPHRLSQSFNLPAQEAKCWSRKMEYILKWKKMKSCIHTKQL